GLARPYALARGARGWAGKRRTLRGRGVRMISRVVLASALVATLAAGSAVAEDAALSALVAEALSANPDLRVAEQLTLAARQRPAQVSARPDPWLALGYTNKSGAPPFGGGGGQHPAVR